MTGGANPVHLSIRIRPFSKYNLLEEVKAACNAHPDEPQTNQAKYLGEFLAYEQNKAATILIEKPYFDRHYLDEYRNYYSTLFSPPSDRSVRIHFFRSVITESILEELISNASKSDKDYQDTLRELNSHYLGFVVVRPIPSAPIGRTVLQAYPEKNSRHYVASTHRIHLVGFNLKVPGVPFQQQEVAVGACATTAIWSALSAISKQLGRRGPTPNEITASATRYLLNNRVTPAAGLEFAQVLDAVRASGYDPYVITPSSENFDALTMVIKCYLQSGIPLILMLQGPIEYHAITLVGYRVSDEEHVAQPLTIKLPIGENDVAVLRSKGITRFYVHDDQRGPYARMLWSNDSKQPSVQHKSYTGSEYDEPLQTVYRVVVPLSPVLRLSAQDLLSLSLGLQPLIVSALGGASYSDKVFFDLKFRLSRDFKQEILKNNQLNPRQKFIILTTTTFPLYVGLIRFYLDDTPICDVVCDTSDINRSRAGYSDERPILAIVSLNEVYTENLQKCATTLRSSVIVL